MDTNCWSNDTCVKSSMAYQAYKVVNTHDHEISGWKILSRLLHERATYLGGMNGGVQYNLSTLFPYNVTCLIHM